MPFPIIGLFWLIGTCTCAGGVCYLGKKAHDAYAKKQNTTHKRLDLNDKIAGKAGEDNKAAQKEIDEWKKKYDDLDERIKKRDEEIKKFQNKLRDPNLSPEERKKINNQLTILLSQQEEEKREKDSIFNKLKKLSDRIKDNNKVISGSTSNQDDKHWIWELLTLENIVIMGGCYALYKILKDDK